jgi:conjugative transposon TraM protein
MELYFKGAAGILLAAVLGLALQKQEKDLSAVLTAAVIAMAAVLMLRLLEPVQAGELYIPANTILTGTAKISGERMEITVSSIAFQGTILPVELDAYDTRGMKGIEVRGSQELTAVKEMAANMGSAMGSSINISTNAGAQLAADLGKGVIQGASQYLSTKFRTAKATLKADYELLLVSRQ